MSSKTIVLVSGATGMTGLEVCRALAPIPDLVVRAGVRTSAKGSMLPANVVPVPFDTDDPATIDAALEGVQRMFLAAPGGPGGPAAVRAMTTAIARHDLERIVKLGSIAPDVEPQAPTDLWALESEAMVRETGVPTTHLQPPWFDQNFIAAYFVPMVRQRILPLPFGDGKAAWVDTRDIAAVAVRALLDDGHEGKTYTPTGPAPISLFEIADTLSQVAGQKIEYTPLSDEKWLELAATLRFPEEMAQSMLTLMAKTRDGFIEPFVTDVVERIGGRPPRSFAEFARDHQATLTAMVAP